MAKMNMWKRMFPEQAAARTHEGSVAQRVDVKRELRRSVLTCLLWEDAFYEKGSEIAKRIAALVATNKPNDVAALACEARGAMQLRHAPLFLVRELARRKGAGPLVAESLERVIQRADELSEFVALYWKEKKQPLSAGTKRGLARAFTKFDVAAPVLMVLPVPRALVVTRPIVRSDERFSSDIVTLSGCDDPATTTTSLSEVG